MIIVSCKKDEENDIMRYPTAIGHEWIYEGTISNQSQTWSLKREITESIVVAGKEYFVLTDSMFIDGDLYSVSDASMVRNIPDSGFVIKHINSGDYLYLDPSVFSGEYVAFQNEIQTSTVTMSEAKVSFDGKEYAGFELDGVTDRGNLTLERATFINQFGMISLETDVPSTGRTSQLRLVSFRATSE